MSEGGRERGKEGGREIREIKKGEREGKERERRSDIN